MVEDARDNTARYLELLKKSLTMSLWYAEDPHRTRRANAAGPAFVKEGGSWPALTHTMLPPARIENIQWCLEDVIARGVSGDFIETGVWRGGACILAAGVFDAYGEDRTVWVADSFEGLPPPDVDAYPEDAGDPHYLFSEELAISLEEVKSNFEAYGLLSDRVQFLKGWFKDSLPTAPIDKLAVLRLDGDMYESTIDAIVPLYPKLELGGFIIIDDYQLAGCRAAIDGFRETFGITDPLVTVDHSCVYWQKTTELTEVSAVAMAEVRLPEVSRRYHEALDRIAELEKENAQLRAEHASLRLLVAQVVKSRSYRITAPARAAAERLRAAIKK